ncbi:hypothetical protein LCGC14_1272400 [marine sediment metagenome]|uniref:Uncharacterized protein n=1 Tax=marine sediment metagenome TaxID=412755 RepID=A0A0F9KZJ4_9ZZZZ
MGKIEELDIALSVADEVIKTYKEEGKTWSWSNNIIQVAQLITLLDIIEKLDKLIK